jgi:dihydroneopterin aldolase
LPAGSPRNGEGVTDRIELRGLRVMSYCGVLPEERDRRQPFTIDVDLVCDLSAAGESDQLADTIDYGAVCDAVETVAHDGRFDLLERFASQVASVVLSDVRVASTVVTIHKTRPPVPQDLASSGVRIERDRTAVPDQT